MSTCMIVEPVMTRGSAFMGDTSGTATPMTMSLSLRVVGRTAKYLDAEPVGVGFPPRAKHHDARNKAVLLAILALVVHRQRPILVLFDSANDRIEWQRIPCHNSSRLTHESAECMTLPLLNQHQCIEQGLSECTSYQ
jgi:hypothetical protein